MAKRTAGRPPRASVAKHLVIMAKSPLLGRVKRRLSREIGDAAATRFYRSCLSHSVLRLASDPRWRTVIAITPDRDIAERFWPAGARVVLLPQGGGDLGRRMQRIFAGLPPGPAIIVGSDIPSLRPSNIAEAFSRLGGADAVLGPARDGGYWLIGLKRTRGLPSPFAGVRWSGPHALADTLANLKGRRIAFASILEDIDTGEAYRRAGTGTQRLIFRVTRAQNAAPARI
jgi:rSAM/selenodomain-associated transferase 1